MINVTDVVIPQPDAKMFFKRNSRLKFIQRKAPLPITEGVMMWQKMISFIQQSEEKELIKYASDSPYGLKSVDIPLHDNQQFTHQVNDESSKIVLKRGQSFYVDLHFDHDLQSAVDTTIYIDSEETQERIVCLYGTMILINDDAEGEDWIKENIASIKLDIPSDCPVGWAKMEIITNYYNNNSERRLPQTFKIDGINIIE